MASVRPSLLKAIHRGAPRGRTSSTDIALVVFETAPDISEHAGDLLLDWGEDALRTCAPYGAVVSRTEAESSLWMLLPQALSEDADAVADLLTEQLNRLPVEGKAPGMGWNSRVIILGGDDGQDGRGYVSLKWAA